MKRLVVFPSDPISAYVKQGKNYDYLENYFNPGDYFDEVFSISLWGDEKTEKKGKVTYIKSKAWELRKLIRELKPDVIRAYGGYISSDLAQLAKIDGIPIVVSVHDTNPMLIHDSIRYADYIVCVAQCVKEAVMNKLNIDDKNIFVMPNRIDQNLFKKTVSEDYFTKLNEKYGNGKHILHIGRKTEQKNLDTVIKSLKYLNDDITAIFVGIGNSDEYEKLAKEIGVGDRCYWVNSVNKEELPLWYSWCDCFCTPSRWEGFGFVFIEAAGCETPIITSNIAPMNEYLTNNYDAILIDDYENPQKIAFAIQKVLHGGKNIERMCLNARDVGVKFSKDKIDKQEISIYEQVISEGAKNCKISFIQRIKYVWKYK